MVYGGSRDREQLPPAGLIGKEGMSHKLGKVGMKKPGPSRTLVAVGSESKEALI